MFTAPLPGTYRAQAFIRGKDPLTGVEYIRTSQHLLKVMPLSVDLQPHASAKLDDTGATLKFDLDVKYTESNVSEELLAYAEVWGTRVGSMSGSEFVPVAWISGAVDVADASSSPHVSLQLDLRWLALANATSPFELRNVRLQNQLIPVSQLASIPVSITPVASTLLAQRMPSRPAAISRDMRQGRVPAAVTQRAHAATVAATSTLLLVHGYCAQYHPFADKLSLFTNGLLFNDLDASRTNDAFAQEIAAFVTAQALPSFGAVAHSQGGLAMLHLHAYYWTNLELAQGTRLLQSVGSPYQGSAIAGSSANMGKVFGVGCGENFDLTHDGAALWLSGINSTAVLDDVYFYTTQYQTGSLVNYCSLPTNLILSWPNDGVTEFDYAPLPGAHNAGHTFGECHTTNMHFPPQCWDDSRDAEINTKAAR